MGLGSGSECFHRFIDGWKITIIKLQPENINLINRLFLQKCFKEKSVLKDLLTMIFKFDDNINFNIITRMYFADQTELLNSLDDDWSILLKNIKKKQELHLSLLQKNQSIIALNRDDKDQEQLSQEIGGIKKELKGVKEENGVFQGKERQIVEKYESLATSFEDVIKLMSRVGARVLQITQNGLQKLRNIDSNILQKHNRMKKNLIGMLNQKQKLNLQHLFNIILDYCKNKLTSQIHKTQKVIKALQNKDFNRLKEVNLSSRDRPRIGSVQKIREMVIERKREYSLNKQQRSTSKRHDHSSHKHKNKGILYNLYNIMQLTKYQIAEEYAGSNEEKKERIFNELMHRNRKNKEHILNFIQLEQNFNSKTKSFEERLERRSCEKPRYNNKSFTQQIVKKKKEHTMTQSITFNQYLATETDLTKKSSEEEILKKRMSGTKTKFFGKQGEDFPFLHNKTMVTQDNQKSARLQIIKKQSLFESRKRKLPQINRGSSLDNTNKSSRIPKLTNTKGFRDDVNNIEQDVLKTNKRKEKWFRDDKLSTQRTKMILKNVEVGGIPLNPRKEEWFVKKEEGVLVRERKKTDTVVQTNTAYCKRTLNKFFDTKMNGFN